MSTNLLLVSPYNVNFYGGVQNQVNLFKNGLGSSNFNVRLLAPDSSDYDIGKSMKIPFNGSSNPISLIPDKEILNEAIAFKLPAFGFVASLPTTAATCLRCDRLPATSIA